ncbi:hypothetical protein PV336_16190 [Streptomyces sp. MI02-2A]|uniref:hypothetical protein n=1 Tax=Streptomyces sp. MI02-2A TaxID=3028688 RepID=UPI0029BC45FE|nr:hypothetical protein [Streptomyces sp. MI02-2A]MDX3260761.1 hypothetical protein [Streptomyces sp. MI02-2A]
MDLTTATPVEIDTALYATFVKIEGIAHQRNVAQARINRIDGTEPGSYESKLPQYSPAARANLAEEVERLEAEITKVTGEEVVPLNAEYWRRPWTRYYLVDNTNGHVHKDQDCTTCFDDTRYAWLIEQSGMSAEDLVELAGEKACTVCFPWAPVDVLKQRTKLEAPERKAARLERERKKAEREAKKAAKAIANPDGSPLKVFDHHWPERKVVNRAGDVVKVHPAHDSYKTLETLHAARGWLTDRFESWRGDNGAHRDTSKVADAIAHKEGKTREVVIEEAKQRAARRK